MESAATHRGRLGLLLFTQRFCHVGLIEQTADTDPIPMMENVESQNVPPSSN